MQTQVVTLTPKAIRTATSVLSGSALRLYMTAAMMSATEEYAVLPLTIVDDLGLPMSHNMAIKARQELVDLGFLTLVSAPCTYRFCPLGAPDAGEKAAAKRMKKAPRLRKKEGGTVEKRAPVRDMEAWELVDF